MMLVKNGYNRKIVRAKRFRDLSPIERKLSDIDKPEMYEDDTIFLEPEPEVFGMTLRLGMWRPILDCMVEVLIEDYKE